ncbi:uncharacterized protein TRUGW13939_05247 [Talaromyces rugulosus]|uniref:Ribonuclease P/MRP protein subunit POP5 n=1 Tax=Talaromyces rugulosus TaxID=121627 RepID=A0A7H8QWC7_TALRU|nr:uncharacterized protein TRUGW13939_05247 [Talaromyces rugulosus]QKX58126.1 hypothetical protein TRUGW13939_05247 [Talaromyces rugulosus]
MVRIKHRYLLVDILYPEYSKSFSSLSSTPHHLKFHQPTADTLTPGLFSKLLRDTVSDLFGDYGVGKLGGASSGNLIIKYLSPATSTLIIRCPRAAYRLVWAALTYMNSVPISTNTKHKETRTAVFRVVRVSGTMRKAEEEAIRRARREVLRTKGAVKQGLDGLLGGIIQGGEEGEDFIALDVDEDDED